MPSQYATTTDLQTFGLPAAALTPVSTPDQNNALIAASALADSYLGQRFRLPLSSWGTDITKAAAEIAAYLVMKKRGWSPGAADAEQIREAYDDALKWLRDVGQGKATPFGVVETGTGPQPSDTGQDAPFVLQPAQGGFGSAGSFMSKASDEVVEVGTPGTPRLRGW